MISLLILIASILFIFKFFKKSNSIPGPISLPIIGSLYSIGKDTVKTFDSLHKKYGKIYSLQLGSVYTVVLNDNTIIHELLSHNPNVFSDRFMLPAFQTFGNDLNIAFTNGVYNKEIRTIVTSAFTKSKIKKLEYNISTNIHKMFAVLEDNLKKQDNIESLREYFRTLTFNIIFNFVFSEFIPFQEELIPEDIKNFMTNSKEIIHLLSLGEPSDYIKILKYFKGSRIGQIRECVQKNLDFVQPYVENRLKSIDLENPRDFIDILISEIKTNKSSNIPMDAIPRICMDLLMAGSDSSSSTTEWFILYMVNYPEIQEKLFNELSLSVDEPTISDKLKYPLFNATIKEVMRISPVSPFGLPHISSEDFIVDGKLIPKGSQILTNFFSANRNEQQFPDPLKFNPLRHLNTNSPIYAFSTGRRKCVAESLAVDEIFLICSKLIRNFKFERLTNELLNEEGFATISYEPLLYKYKITKRV